jgi:hypothetical protein
MRVATKKESDRYTGKLLTRVLATSSNNSRVHDVSFAGDGEVLELSVSKTTWQAAFDHVDITFGHTTDDHVYRRHIDFTRLRHKRQNKVDIPADTPDDVNTVAFDLASEIRNNTFGIESFLSAISDATPLPIEIGFKQCSTRGQIALAQGAFNIDASQVDLIPDVFEGGDNGKEITSVITGGFMELVATGVGARFELFARPAASGGFEISLFQVPVAGFVIPGVGKAGAIFEPRIAFDFEVSGALEVNYGLEVRVCIVMQRIHVDTDMLRFLMDPPSEWNLRTSLVAALLASRKQASLRYLSIST